MFWFFPGHGFWRSGEFLEWAGFSAEKRTQTIPTADCVIPDNCSKYLHVSVEISATRTLLFLRYTSAVILNTDILEIIQKKGLTFTTFQQ